MKIIYSICFLLLFYYSYSQETATTESGKKVVLNKNGTYKYVKEQIKEPKYINISDFKEDSGKIYITDYIINLKKADDTYADVNFGFIADAENFKTLDDMSINKIIFKANAEAMERMKNKYTYEPKKIIMTNIDDFWLVTIEYTAQNDYGALKNGAVIVTLTPDGYVYRVN